MKLSTPIYQLKRQARTLARDKQIPLHQALDHIAAHHGYSSWGLLAARYVRRPSPEALLRNLKPADIVLLGAQPGQVASSLSTTCNCWTRSEPTHL